MFKRKLPVIIVTIMSDDYTNFYFSNVDLFNCHENLHITTDILFLKIANQI